MLKYISILLLIFSCRAKVVNSRENYSYIYSYKQSNSDTTIVSLEGGMEKNYKCSLGEIEFTYSTKDLYNKKMFSCIVKNEKKEVIEVDSMFFSIDNIRIRKYFFRDSKMNKILYAKIFFEESEPLVWYALNKNTLSYNSFSTFLSLINYDATNDISCTPFWNLDMLNLNSFLISGLIKHNESDTVWEVEKNGIRLLTTTQNHLFKINSKKELIEHIIVGNSKKSFMLNDTIYKNTFAGQDSAYQKYFCTDYLEGTSKEIFKSKSALDKDSLRIKDFGNKDVTIITIKRKKNKKFEETIYSNGIIIKKIQ